MMLYHFGVARQLSLDTKFMGRVKKIHGTSGGAIAAAMLVSCPDRFDDATTFFESGDWLRGATAQDVFQPHTNLVRKSITDLQLDTNAHRLRKGGYVAHATRFSPLTNVAITDFETDKEVLDAIAASCCLSPAGVAFRGERLYDGGLSDPLPSDPDLETVAISIFDGIDVDLSPDLSFRKQQNRSSANYKQGYVGSPFLRFAVSPQNAHALLEGVFLTPRRARARYHQGQRDAITFLQAWHCKN